MPDDILVPVGDARMNRDKIIAVAVLARLLDSSDFVGRLPYGISIYSIVAYQGWGIRIASLDEMNYTVDLVEPDKMPKVDKVAPNTESEWYKLGQQAVRDSGLTEAVKAVIETARHQMMEDDCAAMCFYCANLGDHPQYDKLFIPAHADSNKEWWHECRSRTAKQDGNGQWNEPMLLRRCHASKIRQYHAEREKVSSEAVRAEAM